MKFFKITILFLIALLISIQPSLALIKIDDTSIDLAIRYGIRMKNMSASDILGSNQINDGTGRSLYIYSPFIQLAMKTKDTGTSGKDIKKDIDYAKKKLLNQISRIREKNEIRFIVDLYGDSDNFAENYKAYLIDFDEYNGFSKNKKTIKPNKSSPQKLADMDNFHTNHPFSAINSYTFKFDSVSGLKKYYLVITENDKEVVRYIINNDEIF